MLLYFFFGRFLLLLFMNDPQGPAIDTGMLFLRILSPFYFVVSLKLVTDGILRGCGMMVRFMIATFSDLILRVGIAIVLSSTALGSTGIWMAWPVGWCIGTGLSLVFYFTAIRKVLAESPAKAEAEGKAASTCRGRVRRRCRNGDPVTLLPLVNCVHLTHKQNEAIEIVHKTDPLFLAILATKSTKCP